MTRSIPSSSLCISALPIAKLLASKTTLKGLSVSGKAKTGAFASIVSLNQKHPLDPKNNSTLHPFFKEVRHRFGPLCIIIAEFLQVVRKSKDLM